MYASSLGKFDCLIRAGELSTEPPHTRETRVLARFMRLSSPYYRDRSTSRSTGVHNNSPLGSLVWSLDVPKLATPLTYWRRRP